MGYAMAVLYFVGTDYGFGMDVCEVYGYGYYVIDGMNYIVAFAKPALDVAAPLVEQAANGEVPNLTGDQVTDLAGAVTNGISDVVNGATSETANSEGGAPASVEKTIWMNSELTEIW